MFFVLCTCPPASSLLDGGPRKLDLHKKKRILGRSPSPYEANKLNRLSNKPVVTDEGADAPDHPL